MTRVAILGSTGSIGTQALEVIRLHSDEFCITALAAHSNANALIAQVSEFRPGYACLFAGDLPDLPGETRRLTGMSGLVEIASSDEVDLVVVSVAGMIGLEPTVAAIRAGKRIALASKEVLVAGGEMVMELVRETGAQLLPIDSEHSAILQCLWGVRSEVAPTVNAKDIDKLILTASGGPFRGKSLSELRDVTVQDALNHPTWKMGGKITIDSATLMNKGLEIIEACWLYGLSPDRVELVVHPQSVIHSMVKFMDGSVLAQMGHPDMKLPIQYALMGPDRKRSPAKNWEPLHTPSLTFEPIDESVFICPSLAREAFRRGGVTPAFLNAVNEVAANSFLEGKTAFLNIQRVCEESLALAPNESATLSSILEADEAARNWTRDWIRRTL